MVTVWVSLSLFLINLKGYFIITTNMYGKSKLSYVKNGKQFLKDEMDKLEWGFQRRSTEELKPKSRPVYNSAMGI